MDFSYREEQSDVKALAQKILGDQTQPEQLARIDKCEDRFDEKLWADLAQAGLLGVAIDEAHGGMGFGFETLCILIEEVGQTVAPVPVIPMTGAWLSLARCCTVLAMDSHASPPISAAVIILATFAASSLSTLAGSGMAAPFAESSLPEIFTVL